MEKKELAAAIAESKGGKDGCDEKGNPPLRSFQVTPAIADKLEEKGIKYLFPIQAQTYNDVFAGRDLIGRARTGQGKTLAFSLPITERILQHDYGPEGDLDQSRRHRRGRLPLVLVMAPTRELASQVMRFGESFSPLSHVCVYGGASFRNQCESMRRGVDVVVGTPGRIIDHLERGTLKVCHQKMLHHTTLRIRVLLSFSLFFPFSLFLSSCSLSFPFSMVQHKLTICSTTSPFPFPPTAD